MDVTYDLKDSFDYSFNGEVQPAQFISLTAASVKQLTSHTPIKQAFSAAINQVQSANADREIKLDGDNAEKKDHKKLDEAEEKAREAIEYSRLMSLWSGDLSKVYLHAQQLFKSIALVDGETSLTVPLMDKMSARDFENLVGTYIANFIAPALMDGE